MIRWFARNDIAANFLMFGIVIAGLWTYFERVPLEVQPNYQLNQVRISVEYRGGSPEDVERNVLVPLERSLEGLGGIDEVESYARPGAGDVIISADDYVDPRDLLDEVKERVDAITVFPDEIEPPRVMVPATNMWLDVIKIAVTGDMEEDDLVKAARRIQDELTATPEISQGAVQGSSRPEIAIEADLARLRDYGLDFAALAQAVRQSSIDLPAGRIQTDEGNMVIRSKGQAYTREDFENIVIRNRDGSDLRVKDVANVTDGYEENRKFVRFNGKPALLIEFFRFNDENALDIAKRVQDYVATQDQRFPEGIELHLWDDSSVELKGRLGTLVGSLLQGGLLVLIILGLFLRPTLALWVVLGIPVAFGGAMIFLPAFDLSLNAMSLFGFIIVLGLVVDDAIVTAENIYTRMRAGEEPLQAAVDGAKEVAVPVTFGAITTIVAFLPLLAFEGYYGNLTRQIPPVVALVLIFSLIESKLALPCHLKHVRVGRKNLGRVARFQKTVADSLEIFVDKCYAPSLAAATRHRYTTLATFLAVGLCALAVIKSGRLGFVNMPSIDRNRIMAAIEMPRETPLEETHQRVLKVEAAAERLKREFVDPATGTSLIEDVLSSSGGWVGRPESDPRRGFVVISVVDPGQRSEPGPSNTEIAKRWTELVGELQGVEELWISGDRGGGYRGGGSDDLESIVIELRGTDSPTKDMLADEIEKILESYEGIAAAWHSSGRTKEEIIVSLKPEGEALGLTQLELARQVRGAFFGEQAQRVQRERDDVRVMVRLPLKDRQSLHTLEELRIQTPDGGNAPFHTVARASFEPARGHLERIDGARVTSIAARPVDEMVNVIEIAKDLAPRLDALLNTHPEYSWRYAGYDAEHEETGHTTYLAGAALLFALYALLAVPFRSLTQPIIVLLAIPFGIIGALFGHMILGITPSYLSIFGILALAGVVVNDSLVMVDFANQKRAAGVDSFTAVVQSGARRFRPILLTSVTTFAGLLPLMLDRSLQAQFLVPMAVSLGFGIIFATFITLYLIPSAYLVTEDILGALGKAWRWYAKPFRDPEDEPAPQPKS